MSGHVLAPTSEVPLGCHKRFVEGRPIAIFNLNDEFFGMLDRCPHQGGSLCAGVITDLIRSNKPGHYETVRAGEFVRRPWNGWTAFCFRIDRKVQIVHSAATSQSHQVWCSARSRINERSRHRQWFP
jgi:nitrite reductase/ring-hydroxylating ferredoxin subunit